MSDDRELTELAAKAAGIEVEWIDEIGWHARKDAEAFESGAKWFRPLADDGDALRLAVRLELTIATGIRYCAAYGVHAHVNEPYDGDPELGGGVITATSAMTATRRAIVKAAAEIGKKVGAQRVAG
jgi:hypothetical protein